MIYYFICFSVQYKYTQRNDLSKSKDVAYKRGGKKSITKDYNVTYFLALKFTKPAIRDMEKLLIQYLLHINSHVPTKKICVCSKWTLDLTHYTAHHITNVLLLLLLFYYYTS